MKRRVAMFLFLPGLFAAAFGAPDASFKDPALETVVRKFLPPEVKPSDPLTQARLDSIKLVSGEDAKIRDLSGLEACPHLTFLFLTGPSVADLAPLAKLTELEGITIEGAKIQNLSPLSALPKLQYLDLAGNDISVIKPLANLKALNHLDLSRNKIADVTPLAGLTGLQELILNGNQVSDLKPLSGLKSLFLLDLKSNSIADVAPLATLTGLHSLYLDQNQIKDAAPLVAMERPDANGPPRAPGYRIVSLKGNPLTAAARTTELPELQKYGLNVEADNK